ncbi:MAG: alpha-amylase [Methanosarcinaceae archaeon]|nr:alpha-amylase [Methanosarcinaceae archaeon]
MKAVCVCFEVNLPLPVKWYWPREGYSSVEMDTYFDMEMASRNITRLGKDTSAINGALADSIGSGGKYAFDISGIFLEQCKWTPGILQSFSELIDLGAGLIASPYYHSVCPFFSDLQEFKTQVLMHVKSLGNIFGNRPVTFANPELLLEQKLMRHIREMGFECLISEGSHNLTGEAVPVHVYDHEVPVLLRHINLSEDIEKRFSDTQWPGFPLIARKFAAWMAGIQGDVITLYIKYNALQTHLHRGTEILGFLRELPLCLEQEGIGMLLPEEAVKEFRKMELPSLYSKNTARYGTHNLLGNHAQHLYLHELQSIGEKLGTDGSDEYHEKLRNIYRYLQQSDILLEINAEERRLGYERAVNDLSILSDLSRSILESGQ